MIENLFSLFIAAQILSLDSKKEDLTVCNKNGGNINAKTGLTQTLTHTGKSPGSTAQYKAAIW